MQFTKQLPIGVSTFSRFKEENLIYVDKTKTIFTIANKAAGKFFLSRPRRFGKSLLVSTLHSLFAEGVAAFSDLAIENLWQDKTYRVIHLDFSKVRAGELNDFINDFNNKLLMALKSAGISFTEEYTSPADLFDKAVNECLTNSLVLLIDEYDSPLIQNLPEEEDDDIEINQGKKQLFDEIQKILRNFYAVIKSNEGKFRFIFVTGITKFKQVSIFSSANSFTDISLDPLYGSLLGYTEEEIKNYFTDYLKKASETLNQSIDEIIFNLKINYDGYCFDRFASTHVFSPWSILNFLNAPHMGFMNYWYDSGLSSLVDNYFKHRTIEDLSFITSDLKINVEDLSGCSEIYNMPKKILLSQAGYFSIRESDGDELYLQVPNLEIDRALSKLMLKYVLKSVQSPSSKHVIATLKTFSAQKIASLFTKILHEFSYTSKILVNESLCRDAIWQALLYSKVNVLRESTNLNGRSDLIAIIGKDALIFEFKLARNKNQQTDLLKEAKNQMEKQKYGLELLPGTKLHYFAFIIDAKTKTITYQ